MPRPRTRSPCGKLEREPGEVEQVSFVGGWTRNQLMPLAGWEMSGLIGNYRIKASGSSVGLSLRHLVGISCGDAAARVTLLLRNRASCWSLGFTWRSAQRLRPFTWVNCCVFTSFGQNPSNQPRQVERDGGHLAEPSLPTKPGARVFCGPQPSQPGFSPVPCVLPARCSAVEGGCFPFAFGGERLPCQVLLGGF